MLFKYKAIKKSGEIYESELEAKSKLDLFSQIKDRGETVVFADEKKKVWWNFLYNPVWDFIKIDEKIFFARNLGAMIGAGLPMSRSLTTLQKQIKSVKFNKILKDLGDSIERGEPFNKALRRFPKVFSPLFVSMVKAGEESGNIAEALKAVGRQMENSNDLKKKVKGALIYPTIIIVAMVIVGILMMIFIVPTLKSTFSEVGADLPVSTQIVIGISDFIKESTVLAIILLIGLSVFAWFVSGTKFGKRSFDFVILRMPIISGIVKEVNSARTARTLSSLLSSGVDVVTSFNITLDVLQNFYYREILENARDSISKGGVLSKVFTENEKLYPPLVGAMIEVGEETGNLPEMLLNIAEFYENEVTQKTKNMSTIIEPFLMVIIGGAVGFFAISMISPMYSLMNSI
ncbi:type II secretion system F family protein [Patescibacteria group bacterium]